MASYLGIDFGTTNSHVTYCYDDEHGKLTASAIKADGDKTSVPTCVLWQDPARDDNDIVAIGNRAMQEWSVSDVSQQQRYRFAFGFKPDLTWSEQARTDARAFLLKVCGEVKKAFPGVINQGKVVIGVPAEIGKEHCDRTVEAATAAGFANVECVVEPLGALAYHLNNGSLTPAEAREGVVVVDFGGGTLDVALMHADERCDPWGDYSLGGRLFDDLFFQWFLDQNPGLTFDDREAMVVWQWWCRELKESFSKRWDTVGDEMADFTGSVYVGDHRRYLRNASVSEFQQRARTYRPSAVAIRYFRRLGLPAFTDHAPIDLIERIRRAMSGDRSNNGVAKRFAKVILTGGSSDWPFMKPLAAEVFQVDPDQILMSDNPEMAIGAGLALFTGLKSQNRERQRVLREGQPKARDEFANAIEKRLDKFADDAADVVLVALMPEVDKEFWDWYRNGGSLARVEQRVQAICEKFKPRVSAILKPQWQALDTDLVRLLRDHLTKFLKIHEITKDVSRYVPESVAQPDMPKSAAEAGGKIAEELGDLAGTITAVTLTVGTTIIAVVKLHLLILAFIHPIITLIAGIAAIYAVIIAKEGAKEAVEKAIREFEFGPATLSILHLAIGEHGFKEKLKAGRESARTELRQAIRRSLDEAVDPSQNRSATGAAPVPHRPGEAVDPSRKAIGLKAKAVTLFEAMISRVIEELGVLEQIRAAG
jgi:molecular chaperone DnaK